MSPGPTSTLPLAWHGLRCRVPRDWEVTGYGQDADNGRLLLETRAGPRAEVAWAAPRRGRAPDLATTLRYAHEKWAAAQDPPVPGAWATERAHGFLIGRGGSDAPLRAAREFPDGSAVFWTFFDLRRTADDALDVLASCAPNTGEWRQWAAWGLDVRVPARLTLDTVQAWPAHVTLTFADAKRQRLRIERLALARVVLGRDPLADFHRRWLARTGHRCPEAETTDFRGHRASRVVVQCPAEAGLEKLLGRAWPGESLLWHDAAADRLWIITQGGTPGCDRLSFDEILPLAA